MVTLFILFGAAIIITVIISLRKLKSYKITPERVIFLSGIMGSGKTLFGVFYTFVLRSKVRMSLWWKRFKVRFHHPFKKSLWLKKEPVYVYSNIPLKSKWYLPLTSNMLLRKEEIHQHPIIFVDEFGSFCNQYDWSNPYVIEQLTSFIRFSRHWLDAYLIITDQTSDSIPKQVRDRLSGEYHLARCRKFFFRWRLIDVYPIQHITDDTKNVITPDDSDPEKNQKYLMIYFNPKKALYDTRCYSESYYKGFVFDRNKDDSVGLKTRYLLDFEPNKEFTDKYKKDKQSARHEVLEAPLKVDPPPAPSEPVNVSK